jgi:amino acid transporter
MNAARPRFSLLIYFYLVTFFLLLGLLPICLVAAIGRLAMLPGYWLASLIWPVAIIAMTLYAQRRCSSDRMRFRDGLLWVTASMMTGWVYMSFFTVWPVLLVVFWGSVFFAIYEDLSRSPGYSQARWHRLVSYFYRNRMRQ